MAARMETPFYQREFRDPDEVALPVWSRPYNEHVFPRNLIDMGVGRGARQVRRRTRIVTNQRTGTVWRQPDKVNASLQRVPSGHTADFALLRVGSPCTHDDSEKQNRNHVSL